MVWKYSPSRLNFLCLKYKTLVARLETRGEMTWPKIEEVGQGTGLIALVQMSIFRFSLCKCFYLWHPAHFYFYTVLSENFQNSSPKFYHFYYYFQSTKHFTWGPWPSGSGILTMATFLSWLQLVIGEVEVSKNLEGTKRHLMWSNFNSISFHVKSEKVTAGFVQF